ncbi:hypothetical protein J4460_03905 [Candidatus Woesearchaeota archaeon]|nr:hypothetical protein [Candidatus Woesearchaeota archaeon]HIH38273.1 hypothetical protein [Candidatus Woesearchaeota archaeon]HIJ04429.1 hypothetical protein [Candidatus Woesearchaeota archaeon]
MVYFQKLHEMEYSGRGVTIGMTEQGHLFIGYTLTGRSSSSQARRLKIDEELKRIIIEVTDPVILSKGDPRLLVYDALAEYRGILFGSNGKQTGIIDDALQTVDKNTGGLVSMSITLDGAKSAGDILASVFDGERMIDGIDVTTFEPDAPNYTPRISGMVVDGPDSIDSYGALHILKRSQGDGEFPCRELVAFPLSHGIAHTITTYSGENIIPLPSFRGLPLEATVHGLTSADDLAQALFESIEGPDGANFQVSAGVILQRLSGPEFAVRNRF